MNFGRVTTTGDLAEGIFGEADGVSVNNFSRIDTSGRGAAGVFVLGEDAGRASSRRSVTGPSL